MNLKHLTDKILIHDTREIATNERRLSAQLLYYLKEIETRRLFSDLGYGSLFEFMIKDLKYTEAAAGRRIRAARLLKTLPEIQKKIEEGKLNFTNVSQAAQLFKNEGIANIEVQKEILGKLEGKSKIQSEMIIQEYKKNPQDLKHLIGLGRETMLKLDKLVGLLGNKSQEEAISLSLGVMIQKVEKEKFALTDSPRSSLMPTGRKVSSAVKREVYKRDRACIKCGSMFRLEFDHIRPYSMGGASSPENLRLLCRSCNQRNRITQFNLNR